MTKPKVKPKKGDKSKDSSAPGSSADMKVRDQKESNGPKEYCSEMKEVQNLETMPRVNE